MCARGNNRSINQVYRRSITAYIYWAAKYRGKCRTFHWKFHFFEENFGLHDDSCNYFIANNQKYKQTNKRNKADQNNILLAIAEQVKTVNFSTRRTTTRSTSSQPRPRLLRPMARPLKKFWGWKFCRKRVFTTTAYTRRQWRSVASRSSLASAVDSRCLTRSVHSSHCLCCSSAWRTALSAVCICCLRSSTFDDSMRTFSLILSTSWIVNT